MNEIIDTYRRLVAVPVATFEYIYVAYDSAKYGPGIIHRWRTKHYHGKKLFNFGINAALIHDHHEAMLFKLRFGYIGG